MDRQNEKYRASKLLFVICWVVYLFVVISRSNYTTAIAFIVKEGVFTKSDAGIISAAFYFTYGFVQLIGGNAADRFSPYKLIIIGLVGALVTNIMLMFFNTFIWVLVLWCLNGVLQFAMWPSVTRIIAAYLLPEHSTRASVFIPLAIAMGNILSFCIASPVLNVLGWKGTFLINSLILSIGLIMWLYVKKKSQELLMPDERIKKSKTSERKGLLPLIFSSGLIFAVFMAIAQGALDTGVKSWVPTMMMESYTFSPSFSNIITAGVNLCNIMGAVLLSRTIGKIKNAVMIQTIYFAMFIPASVFLIFVGKIPAIVVFLFLVIATTSVYAMININVRISSSFDKFGYSGAVSGIINSGQCVGIVAANGGLGIVAERFGWSSVALVWCIVAVVAIAMGIPGFILWKRFIKKNKVLR